MTFGLSGAALAGIAVGGAGLAGAYMSSQAQQSASQTQANSAQAGINAQQQQFAQIQQMLQPYAQAGTGALTAQQNLLGLNGTDAQTTAINNIKNSSQFQGMQQMGQNAILQNASATGGLRGGNVQAALGQFQPQLLNSLIQQQYSNLGGISSMGQNAAAMTGNAGMSTTNSIANLLQQQGAATAGGQLAAGNFGNNVMGDVAGALGIYKGLGGKF